MWVPIETGQTSEEPPYVAIAAHQRAGRWASIELVMAAAVARHLGVADGGRVKPFVGQLGDNGWVMVRADDTGRLVQVRCQGRVVRVRFSGRLLGVSALHAGQRVPFKLADDGCLMVRLPRWAWPDPDYGDDMDCCPHCGGTGLQQEGRTA